MSIFSMDAHMHCDLYKDRKFVADYIENQKKSYTISVTSLPDLFEKYYHEYQKYKYMKLALGFHPELVLNIKIYYQFFLEMLIKTRYIGEIGLDFFLQMIKQIEISKRKYLLKLFKL